MFGIPGIIAFPKERNFFPVTIPYIPIQQIIGNVGGGAVQPLGENGTLPEVKIEPVEVVEIDWPFPVEIVGDLAPKFGRVLYRLLVHLPVLGIVADIAAPRYVWIGKENQLLRRHHSD